MDKLKPVAWKMPRNFKSMYLLLWPLFITGIVVDNDSMVSAAIVGFIVISCTIEIISVIKAAQEEG